MIRIKPQHLQKVIEMLADSQNKHLKVRGTINNNVIFTLDDTNDILDRSYGGYQCGVPTPITQLYFMHTVKDVIFIGLESDEINDDIIYDVLPLRISDGSSTTTVTYINEALHDYGIEVERYDPPIKKRGDNLHG